MPTARTWDVVLWTGQDAELDKTTNFWEALESTNAELADTGLYMTRLFEEDQVILTSSWRGTRVRLEGPWQRLVLYRLSDVDLLLSKLMRDDPIDQADAMFLIKQAGLALARIRSAISEARVPPIPEIEEQFAIASRRLLDRLGASPAGA